MTTAGDNITKANIVTNMASLDGYNNGIVWGTHNQPFQTNITGGDASGYPQTLAADISDVNATASTIVANFRGYANLLSRIRSVRLQKWYQIDGNPRAQLNSDETNITNLNANYAANMNTVGSTAPTSGGIIDASDLDDFVNSLSTAINNNRLSTVLIEEFYCHSNCHASCHGSI